MVGGGPSDHDMALVWSGLSPNLAAFRSYARGLTKGDLGTAEDIVSEALIRVAGRYARTGVMPDNPRAYTLTTLRNVFVSRCRMAHDRQPGRGPPEADLSTLADHLVLEGRPTALEALEVKQSLAALDLASARFNQSSRTLFRMRFLEELSYAEIARQLSITEPLARKRVQVLRARLRAVLAATA